MPSSAEAGRAGDAGAAWIAVAAVLGLGSLALAGTSPTAIDWEPALAWVEPWRSWSAAWLHYSRLHLVANLAGLALVGALGRVGRLPRRTALAWLLAWPSTQLGLLIEPTLGHYGGLSGVLHAGVAAAAIHLLLATAGPRRLVGGGLLVALAAKVVSEAPWAGPLRFPAGWDIAVAPLAHATGLVAGAAWSALAEAVHRRALTIVRDDH